MKWFAGETAPVPSIGPDEGDCEAMLDGGVIGFVCTLDVGHLDQGIPHVACGSDETVAIWTDEESSRTQRWDAATFRPVEIR